MVSIDAYRGFVMLLMMAEILRLAKVAARLPESTFWAFLAHHQSHVPWVGCTLHDLIQPSFSFLVGVALPFSLASRISRGGSTGSMVAHAAWRALVLIFLGIALRSIGKPMIHWTFEDTLTQIGLGYVPLFLLGLRPRRDQWIAFTVLLVGIWIAFVAYPTPGPAFDYAAVGVPSTWSETMTGLQAHWNKNSNLAWAFDTWFLNLFPRTSEFLFHRGGYATLSFIPTLATMILGLIAGGVLRDQRTPVQKAIWLTVVGGMLILGGALAGAFGLCPVVKRIWTPSWVLFSGGWCFFFLAGFYVITDIRGWKGWAFPLVVIGANSIAAYIIAHLWDGFLSSFLVTAFGRSTFQVWGEAYEPFLLGAAVLLIFWWVLYWMYRRKLFLKV